MSLKLYTFNVNGIRAIGKKGFWDWLQIEQPDVLCIQEIKAGDDIMRGLVSGHPDIGLRLLDNQITDSGINCSAPHQPEVLQNGTLKAALNASFEIQTESLSVQEKNSTKNENETTVSTILGDLNELNYDLFWHACSMKKGYSGTAIFYKPHLFKKVEVFTGLGNPKFDVEGRLCGLKTEHFTLINCYYPQGGREGRIPYKLEFYQELHKLVTKLQAQGEKVILTGDFNSTLGDIDLARPKENRKTTGCLPEERAAMNWFLDQKYFDPAQLQVINPDFTHFNDQKISLNFIDAFRHFYPDESAKYTYWDQITRARDRNVGWRIDYFAVDPALESNLKSAQILNQVMGSDHCPMMVELEF